jgi:alpha-amylase
MTRREEGYHDQLSLARTSAAMSEGEEVSSIHHIVLAKEDGLERFLHYDWYRRSSFIDHFLPDDVTLEEFASGKYDEQGDFVTEPFEWEIARGKTGLDVHFRRQGKVLLDGAARSVEVAKRVFIPANGEEVAAEYILRNLSEYNLQLWFGVEFNFGLQAGNAPDRYYEVDGKKPEPSHFASSGKAAGVNEVSLTDEWHGLRVALCLDKAAELWRFPIETISQSEGGFERVYQNSVVFPNWRFRLTKAEEWRVRISARVAGLESR